MIDIIDCEITNTGEKFYIQESHDPKKNNPSKFCFITDAGNEHLQVGSK